jgi:hypothetical protein
MGDLLLLPSFPQYFERESSLFIKFSGSPLPAYYLLGQASPTVGALSTGMTMIPRSSTAGVFFPALLYIIRCRCFSLESLVAYGAAEGR